MDRQTAIIYSFICLLFLVPLMQRTQVVIPPRRHIELRKIYMIFRVLVCRILEDGYFRDRSSKCDANLRLVLKPNVLISAKLAARLWAHDALLILVGLNNDDRQFSLFGYRDSVTRPGAVSYRTSTPPSETDRNCKPLALRRTTIFSETAVGNLRLRRL